MLVKPWKYQSLLSPTYSILWSFMGVLVIAVFLFCFLCIDYSFKPSICLSSVYVSQYDHGHLVSYQFHFLPWPFRISWHCPIRTACSPYWLHDCWPQISFKPHPNFLHLFQISYFLELMSSFSSRNVTLRQFIWGGVKFWRILHRKTSWLPLNTELRI